MTFKPFVYGLIDQAEPSHVRYVGMAPSNPNRPYSHAKRARKDMTVDSHLMRWVRKIQAEGREPSVMILEELAEGTTRNFLGFVETCYIKSLRAIGHRLTNENDGGWGGSNGPHTPETVAKMKAGWTPEVRARVGAASRERELGKKRSTESLEKQKASWTEECRVANGQLAKERNTGQKRSDETRAAQSAAAIGKPKSEESKAKNRDAHLGKTHTEAAKAAMSASRKGNQYSLGFKHSEETKAKRSEALKLSWAVRMADPVIAAEVSAARKAAWAKRRAHAE